MGEPPQPDAAMSRPCRQRWHRSPSAIRKNERAPDSDHVSGRRRSLCESRPGLRQSSQYHNV